MAKPGQRIAVTLACTDCKHRNYQTQEVQAQHARPRGAEQVLPELRQAHGPPRDPLGDRWPTSRHDAPDEASRHPPRRLPRAPCGARRDAAREVSRLRRRTMQFIRECRAELGRVAWPDRGQLWQATAVVIRGRRVVGIYLYALDSVFKPVAGWIVDKQQARAIRKDRNMFRWYVVNTYSGHEEKVSPISSTGASPWAQEHAIRRIVVPTEEAVETKDGQKVQVEQRSSRGTCWWRWTPTPRRSSLVRNTPGVTGFVGMSGGARRHAHPVPLSQARGRPSCTPSNGRRAEAQDQGRLHARPARQGHVRARSPTSTVRSSRSTPRRGSSRCTSRSSSARCPSS